MQVVGGTGVHHRRKRHSYGTSSLAFHFLLICIFFTWQNPTTGIVGLLFRETKHLTKTKQKRAEYRMVGSRSPYISRSAIKYKGLEGGCDQVASYRIIKMKIRKQENQLEWDNGVIVVMSHYSWRKICLLSV